MFTRLRESHGLLALYYPTLRFALVAGEMPVLLFSKTRDLFAAVLNFHATNAVAGYDQDKRSDD